MRRLIRPQLRTDFQDLFRHVCAEFGRQKLRHRGVFIEHSTPVLYFGRLRLRDCSVITVGNNPSFGEFEEQYAYAPKHRFAHSGPSGIINSLLKVSAAEADEALRLMDSYFHRDDGALVYRPFFDPFSIVLSGLGMGTYRDGRAAHTDIATPFATLNPLSAAKNTRNSSRTGLDWNELHAAARAYFLATVGLCPAPKVVVGIGKHGFDSLEALAADGLKGFERREVAPEVTAVFGVLERGGRSVPVVWGEAPHYWFRQRAFGFLNEDMIHAIGRGVAATLRELGLITASGS